MTTIDKPLCNSGYIDCRIGCAHIKKSNKEACILGLMKKV